MGYQFNKISPPLSLWTLVWRGLTGRRIEHGIPIPFIPIIAVLWCLTGPFLVTHVAFASTLAGEIIGGLLTGVTTGCFLVYVSEFEREASINAEVNSIAMQWRNRYFELADRTGTPPSLRDHNGT